MIDFKNLLRSVCRHRLLFIVVSLGIFVLGSIVIFQLPKVFSSQSRIVIERPNTYVASGAATGAQGDISHRMHAIIASVLSTKNIEHIIDRYKLIENNASEEDRYLAIESFREDAQIEFDNVAVINQYTGKSGMFSMGLLIEYRHTDPETAYEIVDALTSDVLEANQGKGHETAQFRRTYLQEQSGILASNLESAEKEVAKFKNENSSYLPELHPTAIRRLDELENQIERSNEAIARLRREKSNTAADLATSATDAVLYAADGTRILGVDEQLRILEVEYAAKSARYSKDHPDVRRMAVELKALRAHASGDDTAGMEAELNELKRQLAVAQQRYSGAHPSVKKLERNISALEGSLNRIARSTRPRDTSKPTNPVYNRFLVRQQALKDDIARETRALNSLRRDVNDVHEQLARMPLVEQELIKMERKVDTLQARYEETQSEYSSSQLSYGMQEANLLEKFELIEPPKKAIKPSSPKKNLLFPVLLVLSFAIGLLAAILRHLLLNKIWHSSDVEEIIDAPVLLVPRLS